MSYSGLLIVFAAAAGWMTGCASAGSGLADEIDGGTVDGHKPDAAPQVDAQITPNVDAPITPAIDAPPGCVVMTRNLLTNPAFDIAPTGMGWVEDPIDPMYPIITADGTVVQSSPNKAWMGGLAVANANDVLHQDVAIPAGTTALALTGFYQVRTSELFGVYDRGKIELTQTGGGLIQQALAITNSNSGTTWTAIAFTFAATHSGTTVRLRLSTTSDDLDETSFYFDSLALNATYCQ